MSIDRPILPTSNETCMFMCLDMCVEMSMHTPCALVYTDVYAHACTLVYTDVYAHACTLVYTDIYTLGPR